MLRKNQKKAIKKFKKTENIKKKKDKIEKNRIILKIKMKWTKLEENKMGINHEQYRHKTGTRIEQTRTINGCKIATSSTFKKD